MDPASISALLSGGSSILGGLGGLFGDDGSDAMNKALDAAKEQYKQGSQAQETAARRNLALLDPQYQTAWRAQQAYLQALGLPYITSDPVLSSLRHNADNYIAVDRNGKSWVVDTIPGYTGGNTPRPVNGASRGGSSSRGLRQSLFGLPGDDGDAGGAPDPNGLNFSAGKGSPIGTINGVTYYRRDEDSLMPYQWAKGSGFQQTPGYQFAMDQGIKALDRSAAAGGRLNSGRQAMELDRFGQGIANQEYGNWLNRVAGVAGQAPQATSAVGGVYGGLGQAGYNSAGNLANLALQGGQYNADAAQRSSSAFGQNMGSIFSGLGSLSKLLG